MWCDACRSVGTIHCAHPDECGNMLSNDAAAENWNAWLDDLPIGAEFHPAIDRLQDFIAGLAGPTPAVQPDARGAARRVRAYLDRRKRAYGMDQNYIHTYDASTAGEVSLIVADLEALVDKPAVQPDTHVNETPKSEHEALVMLTPAAKGGWQPIETAKKDRVIDLWSQEGGRYPDAIWGVCGDTEGWTDANDHGSLGGGMFTHWRDRPAPPATKGGDA